MALKRLAPLCLLCFFQAAYCEEGKLPQDPYQCVKVFSQWASRSNATATEIAEASLLACGNQTRQEVKSFSDQLSNSGVPTKMNDLQDYRTGLEANLRRAALLTVIDSRMK